MRGRVTTLVLALGVTACSPSGKAQTARSTLVIGLDISGSFRRNPSFNGAIEFASLYIYGHLNGIGGLQPNTAIFVRKLRGAHNGQRKVATLNTHHRYDDATNYVASIVRTSV